jgi:hypothetical protein
MTLDLTDDEAAALARYLRGKLDDERFPFAPRLDPLKAILAKLDPPAPRPEPPSPLRPSMEGGSDETLWGPDHGTAKFDAKETFVGAEPNEQV